MKAATDPAHGDDAFASGYREDPASAHRTSDGADGRASSNADGAPKVSLRDEVLAELTPARRAILVEHANRIPHDDIVWGIALVLQDLHDDSRSESRRLRSEMRELQDVLHQSRGRVERELDAATGEWRQAVDKVLREHRDRDETAMQRAVERVQDDALREIVDTHLPDILRALSPRLMAMLALAVLAGAALGVVGCILGVQAIALAR